jgi:hypothetical protein
MHPRVWVRHECSNLQRATTQGQIRKGASDRVVRGPCSRAVATPCLPTAPIVHLPLPQPIGDQALHEGHALVHLGLVLVPDRMLRVAHPPALGGVPACSIGATTGGRLVSPRAFQPLELDAHEVTVARRRRAGISTTPQHPPGIPLTPALCMGRPTSETAMRRSADVDRRVVREMGPEPSNRFVGDLLESSRLLEQVCRAGYHDELGLATQL